MKVRTENASTIATARTSRTVSDKRRTGNTYPTASEEATRCCSGNKNHAAAVRPGISPDEQARSTAGDARQGSEIDVDVDVDGSWCGTFVAERADMAKLEARFHPPDPKGVSFIVVGHINWGEDGTEAEPRIQPSKMLALAPAPATILATLRHLVRRVGGSRERLVSLRTQHWSFVEVSKGL